MPYPILDPTGTTATRESRAPRAPRRRDLRGATVGLLVNTKQNAAPFLDEVGRLLIAKHGATGTMARTKVNFEAPGLPAAAICSDAFRVTADAMAELRGAPGYRYATTPHPVAVLTPDQVKQRAAQVLDDVMNLLTEPE